MRGARKGICCRYTAEESMLTIAGTEESRLRNAINVTPITSTSMSSSTGVANGEHVTASLTCADSVPSSLLIHPFWRMCWMFRGILTLSRGFHRTTKQGGCVIVLTSMSSPQSNLMENASQEWPITGKVILLRAINIAETILTFVWLVPLPWWTSIKKIEIRKMG